MLRKCYVCDEKGEKTIDTRLDDYIKCEKGYAHSDCHKIKLTTRRINKMNGIEAEAEIDRLKDIMRHQQQEVQHRDDLINLLKEYYKITIPPYFFMKLNNINTGEYKGLLKPITNYELYEMYSNRKMMIKLEKIASKKNMKKNDRLNWDLAIMIGEYDNYIKAKNKRKIHNMESKDAIETIQKYKIKIKNKNEDEKNDDIVDINELVF